MKSNFFAIQNQSLQTDAALLLLRIVIGCAFAIHGWGKIQNPFHWMGSESSIPGVLQGLAALSEFGGGLAWAVGLLTRLAALGIGSTMAVAVYLHLAVLGDPFVNPKEGGSYELAAVYLSVALLLFTAGPGRFSLDRILLGARSQEKPS